TSSMNDGSSMAGAVGWNGRGYGEARNSALAPWPSSLPLQAHRHRHHHAAVHADGVEEGERRRPGARARRLVDDLAPPHAARLDGVAVLPARGVDGVVGAAGVVGEAGAEGAPRPLVPLPEEVERALLDAEADLHAVVAGGGDADAADGDLEGVPARGRADAADLGRERLGARALGGVHR